MSDTVPSLPVTHLLHVGLRVPDPAAAARWYNHHLGLGIVDPGSGEAESRRGVRLSTLPPGAAVVAHHELELLEGDPGVDHVAFAVPDAAALDRALEHLKASGVDVGWAAAGDHGPALRLQDPEGLTVELAPALPPRKRPAGTPPCDLLKLGHVTRKALDPPAQAAWWQEVMGFRLSDRMGENFYWLRCNRDHHSLAFVRAPEPGTHHVALECGGWEDFRRLGDHLVASGATFEFGPGRHGPGRNIFAYLLDPWGIRWEIYCDMERIDDDAAYPARVWDPAKRRETVNRWGGAYPPASYFE